MCARAALRHAPAILHRGQHGVERGRPTGWQRHGPADRRYQTAELSGRPAARPALNVNVRRQWRRRARGGGWLRARLTGRQTWTPSARSECSVRCAPGRERGQFGECCRQLVVTRGSGWCGLGCRAARVALGSGRLGVLCCAVLCWPSDCVPASRVGPPLTSVHVDRVTHDSPPRPAPPPPPPLTPRHEYRCRRRRRRRRLTSPFRSQSPITTSWRRRTYLTIVPSGIPQAPGPHTSVAVCAVTQTPGLGWPSRHLAVLS